MVQFFSPKTWLEPFLHLECLSPSLHFLILPILAGTATLSYMFSLGLYLLVCNKGELDLLTLKFSPEA